MRERLQFLSDHNSAGLKYSLSGLIHLEKLSEQGKD